MISYNFQSFDTFKFYLIIKIILFKEATMKKDVEIVQFQAFKEQCEKSESCVNIEKLRSRLLKSSTCIHTSTDLFVALKLRIV